MDRGGLQGQQSGPSDPDSFLGGFADDDGLDAGGFEVGPSSTRSEKLVDADFFNRFDVSSGPRAHACTAALLSITSHSIHLCAQRATQQLMCL